MTPSQSDAAAPRDPVAAATHPDPYPYYARLVAERPLYRDDGLGLWVASSAAMVAAVLSSPLCRVRPPAEPVPKAIKGSPAGEIFRQLVRMNDGDNHCPMKGAIVAALSAIAPERIVAVAEQRAQALETRFGARDGGAGLTRLMFALPVQAVAALLDLPETRLDGVTEWVSRVVLCFSSVATSDDIAAGKGAGQALLDLFGELFANAEEGLVGRLAAEARRAGRGDPAAILANAIGFLTQSQEATAGLIGNSLLALATHDAVRVAVKEQPELTRALVAEVLRWNPPTQSTRRFVAEDGVVAGQEMRAGDTVLVLLGAAARDPATHPEADGFDVFRQDRRILNFGAGPHGCPADTIAPLIAATGVRHLLDGLDFAVLPRTLSYRRSVAIRMPVFAAA
jgi:cytochrome P450